MVEPYRQTYPPRVITAALGIPAGTLASWAGRNYFEYFDAASTKSGRARRFSFSDFLSLAVFKIASDHGLLRPELLRSAPDAVKRWQARGKEARALTLPVIWWDSEMTAAGHDSTTATDAQAERGKVGVVEFRLDRVARVVDIALGREPFLRPYQLATRETLKTVPDLDFVATTEFGAVFAVEAKICLLGASSKRRRSRSGSGRT